MALTVDKLVNKERFAGDNILPFLLYLPVGLVILVIRLLMALMLWIGAIILPNKSVIRHMVSVFACWTFGIYVEVKGTKDPRCSVLVANYVSILDSLAASHVLGTISLRKWKVPPFFASTLGIKNTAQFVRKQHFAESPSTPVLLQPEGVPTNGRGLLKFTDWPFPLGNRVQPVAISIYRPFTRATVHDWDYSRFPWREVLWFLVSPATVYTLRLLPAAAADQPLQPDDVRRPIADELQIEATDFTHEQLIAKAAAGSSRAAGGSRSAGAPGGAGGADLAARRVKEVLPDVPLRDIMRDLAQTRNIDLTITNFLEGVTRYTPEPPAPPEPQPSTSQAAPRYVTPVPTGTFPRSARERELSFQERKARMLADARARYVAKHHLDPDLRAC